MLVEAFDVFHNDESIRDQLGIGRCVGMTTEKKIIPVFKADGTPLLNEKGEQFNREVDVPVMLVLWDEAREVSPSFHSPEELSHNYDFSFDDDDSEETEETEESEKKDIEPIVLDSLDGETES